MNREWNDDMGALIERPLEGEVFDQAETLRRVSEYRRRFKTERLAALASSKHHQAQSKAVRVVKLAASALQSAYETGCVLMALQSKMKGSFLDGGNIRGTDISKSAGYRYMDLAKGWHLLGNFDGMPSVSAALRHIEGEKAVAEMMAMDELPSNGDDDRNGDDPPLAGQQIAPRTRIGRPRSGLPDKVRRRVSTLVADVRQGYHEDPVGMIEALAIAKQEVEHLIGEVEEYRNAG